MVSSNLLWAANVTVDEPPFMPVSPRVMAQGGAFVAVADGYDALFYNPAGFANTTFSLTLASLSAWAYLNPAVVQQLIEVIPSGNITPDAETLGTLLGIVNDQITTGGLGVGASTGFGLVAGGLGLGGALVLDSSLYGGRNMLDLSGDLVATLGFVAGYALDINLLGMVLNIGADVRPMYRIHSIIPNRQAIEVASNFMNGNIDIAMEQIINQSALTGLGVGIDIGAILELGKLQFGLTIKDLFGTKFEYFVNPMSDVITAISNKADIPETTPATDADYIIPMDISAGVGLKIDFLKPLLDINVQADLQDVIGVIKYNRTPWTLLHIGAEATLLGLLNVRAGFNQGYITFGGGIHLLILDLNVAAFTRELGQHIGDQPNSGAVIELAIRL